MHPRFISSKDVKKIARLRNLRELQVTLPNARAVYITEDVVATIYNGCKKLEKFRLEGKIEKKTILKLSENFDNLEVGCV